jgi:hypothetical protein
MLRIPAQPSAALHVPAGGTGAQPTPRDTRVSLKLPPSRRFWIPNYTKPGVDEPGHCQARLTFIRWARSTIAYVRATP